MLLDHPRPLIRGPYRFTLGQYESLIDQDFFGDRRVEFIDGEIIDMPPQKDAHQFAVWTLLITFARLIDPNRFWARPPGTLKVAGSMPEPDVAIVPGPPLAADRYPDKALLVIEVSDTTLNGDLHVKSHLYAAGAVPEYWVVNIPDRCVIVHRQPVADSAAPFGHRYASLQTVRPGEWLSPQIAPDAILDPAGLF